MLFLLICLVFLFNPLFPLLSWSHWLSARHHCNRPARGVNSYQHSRFVRGAADLPWQGVAVRLQLQARRFFCLNDSGQQQIFSERLAKVIAPHARRTLRLDDALRIISFALGGNPGARLAVALGMSVSHDTRLAARAPGCATLLLTHVER